MILYKDFLEKLTYYENKKELDFFEILEVYDELIKVASVAIYLIYYAKKFDNKYYKIANNLVFEFYLDDDNIFSYPNIIQKQGKFRDLLSRKFADKEKLYLLCHLLDEVLEMLADVSDGSEYENSITMDTVIDLQQRAESIRLKIKSVSNA